MPLIMDEVSTWIESTLVRLLIPILAAIAGLIVVVLIVKLIIDAWAKSVYPSMWTNTKCDIDTFCNHLQPNPPDYTKVVLAHKLRLGSREPKLEAIPLECTESPHVPGLKVTRRAGTGNEESTGAMTGTAISLDQVFSEAPIDKKPIVVCTIRMGFGHHRLAYSACSWALSTGHPTIFHDLISIQSEEANLIKSTDDLYSKMSRLASEMGGIVEHMWGQMMLGGNADALRLAALTAIQLQPLLLAIPKDTPIITTHQLCALTASAAGFNKVYNLVVDNRPQWFLTVPNTLNLCQGPVNYQSFLRMGVKPKELDWAGHWCPVEMVKNIETDCQRRINRAQSKQPVRILIPVGGAGAQRKFIINLVRALSPLVKQDKVHLLLNAGDHAHMRESFLQALDECSLDFDTVNDTAGVYAFQKRLLAGSQMSPTKATTLFAFDEYFPAVATTDILCRVADVLAAKPSELAFYCLPKLHIRRVGDHEADSAKRASELGDGTEEAREITDAMEFVNLMLSGPELLTSMNQAIIDNNKIGLYNGCKKTVALALGEDCYKK